MRHLATLTARGLLLSVGAAAALALSPVAAHAAAPSAGTAQVVLAGGGGSGAGGPAPAPHRATTPDASPSVLQPPGQPAGGIPAPAPQKASSSHGSSFKTATIIVVVLAVAGIVFWAKRNRDNEGSSGSDAGYEGIASTSADASHPDQPWEQAGWQEPTSSARQDVGEHAGWEPDGGYEQPAGFGGQVAAPAAPWSQPAAAGSAPAYGSRVDVAVRDADGNILLVESSQGWGLPAGHVNGDATLFDAASRVLGEVTGWPVPAGDQLDADVVDDDGMSALVQVRLVVSAPEVPAGAWGTVEQAANALPGDARLRQLG